MLELRDSVTINARNVRSGLFKSKNMFIDISKTPTGFTGGNFRYMDDVTPSANFFTSGDCIRSCRTRAMHGGS